MVAGSEINFHVFPHCEIYLEIGLITPSDKLRNPVVLRFLFVMLTAEICLYATVTGVTKNSVKEEEEEEVMVECFSDYFPLQGFFFFVQDRAQTQVIAPVS